MKRFLYIIVVFFLCSFSYGNMAEMPVTIDSRIRTFIHSENEIYSLKFKLGYQSIIEFGKDESIELISIGDPYPWKMTPIDRRLFVKANEPNAHTNMTVITNKRVYLFDITSDLPSDTSDNDIVHVVRFFYPEHPLDKTQYDLNTYRDLKTKQAQATATATTPIVAPTVATNTNNQQIISNKVNKKAEVNLQYSFTGEDGSATPLEVFDDKIDTYFRFKDGNSSIPKIYAVREKGDKKIEIKTKLIGDYIVINGVYNKLFLDLNGSRNYIYNDMLEEIGKQKNNTP